MSRPMEEDLRSGHTTPFNHPRSNNNPACKKKNLEPKVEPNHTKKVYLTHEEEKALLLALKDLAQEGWKAGQGWKRGTHEKAAAKVRSVVAGSAITAKNVENKLHNWGKMYRLLNEFSKLSGVAIDQGNHTIIVDSEDMWTEYEQVNSKFLQLRGKSFPYYELWCELFGQYRATGAGAKDHLMAEKEASASPAEILSLDDDLEEETKEAEHHGSPVADTVPSSVEGASSVSRGKRKRANPEIQSQLSSKCTETLSGVDALFHRAERLFYKQEQVVQPDSEMDKTIRLMTHLEEHELSLEAKVRLVHHLIPRGGQYCYFINLDKVRRDDFIKLFLEGKLPA